MSDRALVQRMAARDSTALNELQRRHWKRLYALCYGLLMDPDRADRVVARAFEHVWYEAPRLRFQATTVHAWLSQLCRDLTGSRSAHTPTGALIPNLQNEE